MEELDMTYRDTWIRRDERLRQLGFTAYRDYLNSGHWKKISKKAYSRANYQRCEVCGSGKVQLHHSTYKWLGDKAELRSVNSFCDVHHLLIHELARLSGMSIRLATNYIREQDTVTSLSQIRKVSTNFREVYNFLTTERKP